MSWIKHDKKVLEKVSESDIEKFTQIASQKFKN
jgi:hypothetical protein